MKDLHKDIFIFEQKLSAYVFRNYFGIFLSIHLEKYLMSPKKASEIWFVSNAGEYTLKFFQAFVKVKGYRDAKIKLIQLLTSNYEKVISCNT